MLVGAAWATPAVLIATGSPPAAASGASGPTPPPTVNLAVVSNGGGMDVANVTASVSLAAVTPAGSSLQTGFSIVITTPRGRSATLTGLTYDPALWIASPSQVPANQTGSVTFTYKGPALTAPTTTVLSVGAVFNNGVNHNSTQVSQRTVSTVLTGTSGTGDPVTVGPVQTVIPKP